MSRKVKNIFMVGLVVILIGTSIITIKYAASNSSPNNEMMLQNNGDAPPELPNGEVNGNTNMEEPPEKPSDDTNSNNDSLNANEMPEMPSDLPNGEMMAPQNDNEIGQMTIPNNSTNIQLIHYVLFGFQSLIIALIIMYLIMSNFNKKTFKETFKSSDKIIIYILSIILITLCLTFIESYITKTLISDNQNNSMNDIPNGFGGENSNISYSGANEITEDTEITSGEYSSSNVDENAILVNGNLNATLENLNITKTGDSSGGDNTSFYGINSALIAKSGAKLTLKNLTIITDAVGANGVFSYGGSATTNNTSSDGTTINISDSTITTKKDNSGGIMTTGGGTTNATNLTINTSGISSAAIRTDRGGGTVTVDGGTYTTTGSGSPAIYSTADVSTKNATLISHVAEGIVIEGKNSVTIDSCDLTSTNTKLNGLSTTYKNIFLYQSMSGDAAEGNATFTASNSKITTNNGDSFYITNTTAIINLENNTIINNDTEGNFLRAKADSWGNDGSNGGNVQLTLTSQNVTGNIVIDNISKLDMLMKSNSYYEGTINNDNTAKSLTLTLDNSSKIKLTGDSYITSLTNEDTSNSNIDFNGYKLYVNGVAIN